MVALVTSTMAFSFPGRQRLRDIRVRLETDSQKDDVRLDYFRASFLGMIVGPIARLRRMMVKALRVARSCNGYVNALSGKRLMQSVADLAESYDCQLAIMLRTGAQRGGSDSLRHASIDGEIHAGDVRTFIGGEERDGSRDFLWLAPATHWDLRGELCDRLLDLFSGKAFAVVAKAGVSIARGLIQFTPADLAVFQFQSPAARRSCSTAALLAAVGGKTWEPEHVRD